MWERVQWCLRQSKKETLAALICELMRACNERYVPSAAAILDSNGETMDASTAYFPLINDINLAEFMSGEIIFQNQRNF